MVGIVIRFRKEALTKNGNANKTKVKKSKLSRKTAATNKNTNGRAQCGEPQNSIQLRWKK